MARGASSLLACLLVRAVTFARLGPQWERLRPDDSMETTCVLVLDEDGS